MSRALHGWGLAIGLILSGCKPAEPARDPDSAPAGKSCVDAGRRVKTSSTWEQTNEGLALRIHVEARPEAKDVRIDAEPKISGNGTLVLRTVAVREVIVDVIVSPMTGHIEVLLPNQRCDDGQDSGSIRVLATWQGAPSLKPSVKLTLASTSK